MAAPPVTMQGMRLRSRPALLSTPPQSIPIHIPPMKMGGFPDRTDKVTDTETKKTKAEAALCAADANFRKMPYKMLSLNSLNSVYKSCK